MRDEGATIEDVFAVLKPWAAARWKKYANSSLVGKLQEKMSEQELNYQAWDEISFREGLTRQPKQKPMFELYCMKYAGDPTQDPVQLLKMLPSPQRPKPKGVSVNNTPPVAMPPSSVISLLTDEVLDYSEEKENAKSKSMRAISL